MRPFAKTGTDQQRPLKMLVREIGSNFAGSAFAMISSPLALKTINLPSAAISEQKPTSAAFHFSVPVAKSMHLSEAVLLSSPSLP